MHSNCIASRSKVALMYLRSFRYFSSTFRREIGGIAKLAKSHFEFSTVRANRDFFTNFLSPGESCFWGGSARIVCGGAREGVK